MSADLLAAVIARPDDDAARDAYAASLTAAGDPRGAFITLQVRYDRGDTEGRYMPMNALLTQHRDKWVKELPGATVYMFRRGFAESIAIDGAAFIAHADAIYAKTPARDVALTATHAQLAQIAKMPALRHVRSLSLRGEVGDEAMRVLASSPHLSALRTLEVGKAGIREAGLRTMTSAPWAASLESLSLYGNAIGSGIAGLLADDRFAQLTELNLADCSIETHGAEALLTSALITRLIMLRLTSNPLHAGLTALAYSTGACALERLFMNDCGLDDGDVDHIAESPSLMQLVQLDLQQNSIHDAGASALSRALALVNLRELDVRSNAIGKEGAAAFAAAELPALEILGLSDNPIYVDGEKEQWRDWDGSAVGEGPVKMDDKQLQAAYGQRFKIS